MPGARKPRVTRPARALEITSKQAHDAFQHCLQLVRSRDVDSYLSLLTLPKKVQGEICSILAFNVEISMVREKVKVAGHKTSDDTSALYRLQFWKDAIESIYGNSNLAVPRQPVAVALCSFAPHASPALLTSLVTSRQKTIGDRPFASMSSLSSYGESTTGALMQLQAEALSRANKIECTNVETAARHLGAAYATLNLIRSSVPLMSQGVVLLPNDMLTLHGLNADKVYKRKDPEAVRALVKDMTMAARSDLEKARSFKPQIPSSLRKAFVCTAASVDNMLKRTEKSNYDLYSPTLQMRNPLLLWTLLYRQVVSTF